MRWKAGSCFLGRVRIRVYAVDMMSRLQMSEFLSLELGMKNIFGGACMTYISGILVGDECVAH